MNNFSTVHAILAQISSTGAAWQKKLKKLQRNHQKFNLEARIFDKTPPNRNFKPKYPVE
jgi:hypothetical protein